MTMNKPLQQRFFEKVEIDRATNCWIFKSSLNKKGYGRFFLDGKCREAYKVCYELMVGEVAPGLHLHHVCVNPPCVNPKHLIPVTRKEHHADLTPNHIAYINKRKTHCAYGHEYKKENLKEWDLLRGRRVCLICARRRTRDCCRKRRFLERQNKQEK